MARRDTWTEEQLARSDERSDAIDRIAARCEAEGITRADVVVRRINRELEREMRPLVEVELAEVDELAAVRLAPADAPA